MLKKVLAVILCLFLMAGLCACGGENENSSNQTLDSGTNSEQTSNEEDETTDNSKDEQSDKDTSDKKDTDKGTNSESSDDKKNDDETKKTFSSLFVICYGDSITEGMGMSKTDNYPAVLQSIIDKKSTQSKTLEVINAGVSGETSNTIMSRANAISFVVAEDISFYAGEDEVKLPARFFQTADGGEIRYRYGKLGNGLSAKEVFIDGKPYTLSGKGEDQYTISREDDSADLTIPKGAEVKFDYSDQYDKAYCAVVLMGANDGGMEVDELIANYKKIAATSEKFIAIIPHYGSDCTKQFTDAFGNATVNLREYCKDKVWSEYNLTKEPKDEYYISEGLLSSKFVYEGKKGDCHLNELGYKVLANLIYDKGVELGYWS